MSSSKPERQVQDQFKLISVPFKEAALDSPSFRALVNHLDVQIDNIDKWIIALVSSIKKLPHYTREFQGYYNAFLEHLVPTFLQDGLIDQEHTVQALYATLAALTKLRDMSVASLTVNSYVVDNLTIIVNKHISHYREVRAEFVRCQDKHDRYLALFMSTSKSKDPVSVIEDARQLHLVRRNYIKVSLDLIVEISQLSSVLDKTLVRLSSDLWRKKRAAFTPENENDFFSDTWSTIRRIQAWSDSYGAAVSRLTDDMHTARVQVEESSNQQFAPLTDVNDYNSAALNARVLADINEKSHEKHGYVFMKTAVDKSPKPVWVRRWMFVKNGIFGMLVLSPSGTFVQETDKIGILLCNVKYTPNEDRRYCFEIKTSDFTMVLQAETLVELKSWLKVFENERNRIMEEMHSDRELFNIASGRYPPIVSELASTAQTSIDKLLTNTRIVHSSGHIITSSKLSSYIQTHQDFFQNHIYNQSPQVSPACVTSCTKSAIILYSIVSPTSVPTALTANIWGLVNWGVYYMHDRVEGLRMSNEEVSHSNTQYPLHLGRRDVELIEAQQKYLETQSGVYFPKYYPRDLIPIDVQMRALFETVIEPGEYCMLLFRCLWWPNNRQELSGRCFFTRNHIYLYMQALGFVSLFKGSVGFLFLAEMTQERDHDVLKLYSGRGVVRMKLYLDECRLVVEKANILISAYSADPPLSMRELLKRLQLVDEKVKGDQTIIKQVSKLARVTQTLKDDIEKRQMLPKVGLNDQETNNKSSDDQENYITLEQNRDVTAERLQLSLSIQSMIPASEDPVKDTLSGLDSVQQLLDPERVLLFEDSPTRSERVFDYSDNYTLHLGKTYPVPPKALLHTLVGNYGIIFKDHAHTHAAYSVSAPWSLNSDNCLQRTILCPVQLINKKTKERVTQIIESMEDNLYYNIVVRNETFKLTVGSPFAFEFRYMLIRNGKDCTRLNIYCRQIFSEKLVFNSVADSMARWVIRGYVGRLSQRLDTAVIDIGRHGMIAKSIFLFGKIIRSDHLQPEIESPLTKVGFFTIFRMQAKKYLVTVVSGMIWAVRMLMFFTVSVIRSFSLQWVLLVVIALLSMFNMFLIGKSSVSYWTVYKAGLFAQYLSNREPIMLQRAVYLQDVQDKVRESALESFNSTGRALEVFLNNSFVFNRMETVDWNLVYGDLETRSVAQRLSSQYHNIGVRRHELMVQLKILNDMEFDIAKAEWENWLRSELNRCDFIKTNLIQQLEIGEVDGKLQQGMTVLAEYCKDCAEQLAKCSQELI